MNQSMSHNLDGTPITYKQVGDINRQIKKLADEMQRINKRIRRNKRNTK